METKHTPGPWRIGSHGPNGYHTVGTERGLMVAMVAHSVNYIDECEQAIGDACLIAAAPELLEALRLMRKHYGNCGNAHQQAAADAADVAIAKATGA